jgi:hypothetical protein
MSAFAHSVGDIVPEDLSINSATFTAFSNIHRMGNGLGPEAFGIY